MHTPNVLVGLDLAGVNAPAILARACQITDTDHIEVVHVCEHLHDHSEDYAIGSFANTDELNASIRRDADQHLESICDRFGISRHCVLEGDPTAALHEYAQGHADLVVVGSHGRNGLQTMWGSTSNALVHGTPCDVLAVHVADDENLLPNHYERILVAVDLSEASIDVMDHAMRIAKKASADVAICHVNNTRKADERRKARQQLAQLGSLYEIHDSLVYFRSGRVAPQIHSLARELYADLIVVGTHGRQGPGVTIGSMANAIMHGSSCDALSVRIAED